MTPAERSIRARIAQEGPITVAAFMQTANNDPDHGYYRGRDPLGRAGDFITAPEISQVFGELIGAWCAVCWQAMGAPARIVLAELGPGRGTLMADALRAAATVPDFAAAIDLHLVETSPTLSRLQKAALRAHKATWHAGVETLPDGALILLANEFFDALPIEQYICRNGVWHLRCVGIDDTTERLCFVDGPVVRCSRPACDDDVWETCTVGQSITEHIADRLVGSGGVSLITDYGHAIGALGETLQAVRNHRPAEVLERPGEADLSAHVDFQALSQAAIGRGAVVHGPVPQGVYLKRLGLRARERRLVENTTAEQRADIRSGCQRLVDPAQMGTLFKAIVLTDPGGAVPPGFEPSVPNTGEGLPC